MPIVGISTVSGRTSKSKGRKYVKVWIHIPSKLVNDDDWPFKVGDPCWMVIQDLSGDQCRSCKNGNLYPVGTVIPFGRMPTKEELAKRSGKYECSNCHKIELSYLGIFPFENRPAFKDVRETWEKGRSKYKKVE